MNTTLTARSAAATPTTGAGIVDVDVHIIPVMDEVAAHLPARWRSYLERYGLRTPSEFGLVWARWMGSRSDAWPPNGKPAGGDLEFLRQQLLDPHAIGMAILNNSMGNVQGMLGGASPAELTDSLLAAGNDWTAEQWLGDERLFASIVLPYEDPVAAVREIERWSSNRRFVQVLLPFRTRHPIGNRKYWPLLEACAHYDLPIAFHPGQGSNGPLTSVGWPSFYYENHVGLPQPVISQITSLACEGAFTRWPSLKVVILEGGWSWIPAFRWRLDSWWSMLRDEVPHLDARPSEYVDEHVWFTTQPLEEPARPGQFEQALDAFGRPDRLLFSSDYPHWDFDEPAPVAQRLPESWRAPVMRENALAVYGRLAEAAA